MEVVSTILTSVCTDNSETTSSAWCPPKKGISEPRSGRRQCEKRAVNPLRRLEWVAIDPKPTHTLDHVNGRNAAFADLGYRVHRRCCN